MLAVSAEAADVFFFRWGHCARFVQGVKLARCRHYHRVALLSRALTRFRVCHDMVISGFYVVRVFSPTVWTGVFAGCGTQTLLAARDATGH